MIKKPIKITPADYAEASVVAQHVGTELLKRMELMTLKPSVILELGSGVGYCTALLKKHYPEVSVIGMDQAKEMLQYAKQTTQAMWVNAEADMLPFANASVDLIFMNLLLPWVDDIKPILKECRRVLRAEGLLMFSSLGPDTLSELRESYADSLLPNLMDMHDLGDAFIKTHLRDPVLDVEHLTLTYREPEKLLYELQATGMLISDAAPIKFKEEEPVFSMTYEIIYGHAWGASETADQVADESGVVKIPLSQLRGRR